MARNILLNHKLTTPSHVGIAFGSLLLCAFALFMCATHARKWRKWRGGACYGCYGHNDDDPVIQVNPQGIQAFQVFGGDVDESAYYNSGEGMLWKKNIMMGGKCQLPDFSGVIIYDTQGNIVPSAANTLRALPWK